MIKPSEIDVRPETDDDPRLVEEARSIASRWGFGWPEGGDLSRSSLSAAARFRLMVGSEGLELREAGSRAGTGLIADWSDLIPRRAARRGGLSRNQPLARAVGKSSRTVLDATAGLGHDSALLACLGYDVTAVERSPVLAAMLDDCLRRALADADFAAAIGGRLTFRHADARDVLRDESGRWDAAYIDPMFPPKRKKSALAKKPIRLVRELVGDDDDAAELLGIARERVRRVIVKRPDDAPPLAEKPTASFPGKLVRYDAYVR